MSLFDDDIDFHVADKKINASVLKRQAKKQMKILQRGDDLAKILPEIQTGYDYHLLSNDNFGSLELLMHVCKLFNPDEIFVTTWSYNSHFVSFIKNQLSLSKIKVCVDTSMGSRKHALYNQIKTLSADKKIQFKEHFGIHSKVTILKSKDVFISIEASANYSENKRIEQFNISTDKQLFDFHKLWIDKIFE
jgi:hypothetical protein